MKNYKIIFKILLIILVLLIHPQFSYPQKNNSVNSKSTSNIYLKKIIRKSIKKYNMQFHNHVNNKLLISVVINEISLKEKKGKLSLFQMSNRGMLEDYKNKEVGYVKINKKTVLIYSDSCKEILINEGKISIINNSIIEELDLVYPKYTELIDQITKWHWGEPIWMLIEFNKKKIKVIEKTDIIQ